MCLTDFPSGAWRSTNYPQYCSLNEWYWRGEAGCCCGSLFPRTHCPLWRESLGAVVFPRATLFGALRDGLESIDETNRVAGLKTRTLENRKGAAPTTHNQIPFQLFYPIR